MIVWICEKCGCFITGSNKPAKCLKCNTSNIFLKEHGVTPASTKEKFLKRAV